MARGFWLSDAFASGGSSGYDHKAMGITALGVWESVKRHFREIGVDVEHDPVTVVGIGDMSGDVFGNGMLQRSNLRLLGAFNHRHVFVDPDPEPAVAFAERRRLFELAGSSWDDYDRDLISAGGGVYERAGKEITVTPEMREALELPDVAEITPDELISALLTAPVDLLWNGGIGTYVKASTETHLDVGDRANDAVRVDAADLHCLVVGEGGNLGFTQRARVEYAQAGGQVYSDAVDNSGGVNCSDHEVNIKILLNGVVDDQDLTRKQRDELLAAMTDEVAALVLRANYRQTAAVSAARVQAPGMVDVHQRHLVWLERVAGLDRDVEGLPSNEELNERRAAGQGLTAPELSVLMGYTKIALAEELLASDLWRDDECRDQLVEYFPTPLRERYARQIDAHPLARELIVMIATNRLVDRAGLSMAHRLAEETSASAADIARAHQAAWRIFDLEKTWRAIDALDGVVAADAQLHMLLETRRLGERATRWLLRNHPSPLDVPVVVDRYAEDVASMPGILADTLQGSDRGAVREAMKKVSRDGVPDELARTIAQMPLSITAFDISEITRRSGGSMRQAAAAYFALDEELELGWFRDRIVSLPRNDRWESLARSALRDDFFRAHAELTASVLTYEPNGTEGGSLVEPWLDDRRRQVDHCLSVLADIRATGRADLAQLSVGLREVRNLILVADPDSLAEPGVD